MSDDFFELYTYDVEYIEEVQAYRIPRVVGVSNCHYGVWRVFERSHEWLFCKKKKGVPVNDR